jgi:hypothetical protein
MTAAGLAFVMLALPLRASASLGGDASTVQADQVQMQGAVMRISNNDTYTVQEMRAATGTMVREFVSSSGKVFAVAWQGPSIPDMRQVLGSYFDQYAAAAQAAQKTRTHHGPVAIQQSDLVVEVSGHARAFAGRAYVPQMVPSGIQPDAIR